MRIGDNNACKVNSFFPCLYLIVKINILQEIAKILQKNGLIFV